MLAVASTSWEVTIARLRIRSGMKLKGANANKAVVADARLLEWGLGVGLGIRVGAWGERGEWPR